MNFFFFVSFLLRRITRTILLSNVFFFLIFRDRFGDNLLISVLREITKLSKRYLYVRYRGSKIALKHVSHPPATNRVTLGVLAIGCKEFLLWNSRAEIHALCTQRWGWRKFIRGSEYSEKGGPFSSFTSFALHAQRSNIFPIHLHPPFPQ